LGEEILINALVQGILLMMLQRLLLIHLHEMDQGVVYLQDLAMVLVV
jgi:hypothetical protein